MLMKKRKFLGSVIAGAFVASFMTSGVLALEWSDAPEPSGSGDVMWAEIYVTPESSGYGLITTYACGPNSRYGKSGTTGGQNLGGGDRLGTRYIYFADRCNVSQAPSNRAFNTSTYVFTLENGYTRYAGALVAPTTTTTTTSPARSGNPCTDPSNPKYVCGWATVSDSGQVSNAIVCAYEVCGSGFFGGQRTVLQTRQEVGGNVAGYGSGSYDFATNRFYPFGVDGAWFTGGDTWEGIRASLQATDTTSTTVRRQTTTTLPTDSDEEDSSTSTLPSRRTTTTTVARRGATTTVAEPLEEDDGESEDDYAELSVRSEGRKFRVQVFSSFVDTDMVIRARSSGKATITWRFSTGSSGNRKFLTNRRLSGYVLSLWIDDERVDSLRIR